MTALVNRDNTPWSVQPGWGIFVDLTPPELLKSRRVRVVRQLVAAALALVLLLCGAAYFLAVRSRSDEQTALGNAQLDTTSLMRQQAKYSGVTKLQGVTTQLRSEIAGLMKPDVALDQLMYRIASCTPTGMTISHASIVLNPIGLASQNQAGPLQIDKTGNVQIGTVSLTGHALHADDVATFVSQLALIPGVLNVVPTSNARSTHGVDYTVAFTLDDRLLSHRFDLGKGGK